MVDTDEDFGKYFHFKPGAVAIVKAKDGRKFVTSMFAADMESAPGLWLRRDNEPDQLIFLTWHNVLSIESEVPIDEE